MIDQTTTIEDLLSDIPNPKPFLEGEKVYWYQKPDGTIFPCVGKEAENIQRF